MLVSTQGAGERWFQRRQPAAMSGWASLEACPKHVPGQPRCFMRWGCKHELSCAWAGRGQTCPVPASSSCARNIA
eukprot:364902-Chlamydomonas_euryale.AAC.23